MRRLSIWLAVVVPTLLMAPGAWAAGASGRSAQVLGRNVVLTVKRTVSARGLPRPRSGPPTDVEPAETRPRRGAPRVHGVIPLKRAKGSRPAGAAMARIVTGTSVPGITIDGKVPPDTQVAVGQSRVMEAVNVAAQVFDRAGTSLGSFDLGSLFDGTAGKGTDPKLVFDAGSSNFLAVYLTKLAGGKSEIDLGVTKDPLGTWTIYTVHVEGVLQDQPKLGVSTDKLTISWNDNGNSGPEQYIVIQKAGVVSHLGSVPATLFGPDSSRLNVVPAVQLSASASAYAVFHNYGSAKIGILRFTGVPGVSTVSVSETIRSVAKTSSPASASQPSLAPGKPASPKLDAGDDRLQSAVWRAGHLWTGGNDSCRFRTDTRSRSCLRVIHVLTSGMTVARDVDITFVGGDLMYPAVMLDRANDFWVGYSSVSTSQFASSEVAEAPGGTIGASIGATIYGSGTGVVDYSGCTSPPAIRFGDYSGVALDPQEQGGVWTAGEFGLAGCSWGTQVAQFTP
jgi:hypothetical protein